MLLQEYGKSNKDNPMPEPINNNLQLRFLFSTFEAQP
jgi:hypothetical protein